MKNIYKTIFFLIPYGLSLITYAFSQTAPGIEWQNTIGGNGWDQAWTIQQTPDGGFITAGESASDTTGDKTEHNRDNTLITTDLWMLKLDSIGNVQWQKTIGGTSNDACRAIYQTADGGYILGAFSVSDSTGDKTENGLGNMDYWIVKTDSIGTIQWQNTIGGSEADYFKSMQKTFDGGYIIAGDSRSGMSGDKTENSNGLWDYWILKIDSAGNITWQNTIGGNDFDEFPQIIQTADSGYFLGGSSLSSISGDKTENCLGAHDFWVLKLDSSGTITWQNTIGGSGDDHLESIVQTAGGYLLGGWSNSNISGDKTQNSWGNYDYWIVKIDSAGNIEWQHTMGGNQDDELYSVQSTFDGGYILGGYSQSDTSGNKTENSKGGADYWILKTDSAGNIIWQKTIGGNSLDWCSSMQQTVDSNYILAGFSPSDISGDKTENCMGSFDYWIIKLAPDTITSITQLPQLPNYSITISPNPLTTQSKLTFKNNNKEKFLFTLYDITGRITESVSTTDNAIILTKDSKQPGVYLFNVVNEKAGEKMNGKIIIAN